MKINKKKTQNSLKRLKETQDARVKVLDRLSIYFSWFSENFDIFRAPFCFSIVPFFFMPGDYSVTLKNFWLLFALPVSLTWP